MKNNAKKTELDNRINRARLAGTTCGLAKYEKTILPVKTEKIIPFPGVSLSDPFQNKLDNFLKEMGYVN